MKVKTKQEKAITLIALIITIVVLLILAVVAITSIQNDSIIEYANNAVTGYKNEQEKESLKLNDYESFINTYKPGGNSSLENAEEMDLVEKYILGSTKTGREISEVFNWDDLVFENDESTTLDESTELIFLTTPDDAWVYFMYKNGIYTFQSYYSEETEITITKDFGLVSTLEYAKDAKGEYIGWSQIANRMENDNKDYNYIKYNNKAYSVLINYNTSKAESVELVYEPQGREGNVIESGTYAGWIILTDRNNLVEIVSPDTIGDKLTLGSGDTTSTVELDGVAGINEKDTAILSYNNAITTINEYCEKVVKEEMKIEDVEVRSVGGTNNAVTPYYTMSTNFNSWFKGNKETVPSGDMQYELDYVKLSYFGKAATTNAYWMASRSVDELSSNVCFSVRCVGTDGYLGSNYLWFVYSSGAVGKLSPSYAVRPVVINPSGI